MAMMMTMMMMAIGRMEIERGRVHSGGWTCTDLGEVEHLQQPAHSNQRRLSSYRAERVSSISTNIKNSSISSSSIAAGMGKPILEWIIREAI